MRGEVRDRILRVLLNTPHGDKTRYWIAKEAESTYPWVREFLMKLSLKKLVEDTKITNLHATFDYWKKISPKRPNKEYMVKNPLKLLKKANLPYALTTYQAENIIQGYLFPSRTDIYIKKEDLKNWHTILSEKGLIGGGNFRTIQTDNHIFYHSIEKDGIKIVSTPQLIVDLLREGGTCVEAAEKLIERMETHV